MNNHDLYCRWQAVIERCLNRCTVKLCLQDKSRDVFTVEVKWPHITENYDLWLFYRFLWCCREVVGFRFNEIEARLVEQIVSSPTVTDNLGQHWQIWWVTIHGPSQHYLWSFCILFAPMQSRRWGWQWPQRPRIQKFRKLGMLLPVATKSKTKFKFMRDWDIHMKALRYR